MAEENWIKYLEKPDLREPVAIAGSPGLRSIGKLAVRLLIDRLESKLFAEIYSVHFPTIYHIKPAYAPHPQLPGDGGVEVSSGIARLPTVKFYVTRSPELIITEGYHADFNGQYILAEKVLDLYEAFGVKRLIVLAGYGREGDLVCCAATHLELLEELSQHGIGLGYEGNFYGFSGLVFGLAALRGIKAICLFGRTEPSPEDPEYPDPTAAQVVVRHLAGILKLNFDLEQP